MKKFVSLSAALMLGTVLAKEHSHVAKAIAKADKHKKGEVALLPKKEEVDSLEEYRVKIDNWENNGDMVNEAAEDSPKTSVESPEQV